MMMMRKRKRNLDLSSFRVSVGFGTEGYETNWLYLIENNDENLAEKGDSVYLECLEGKNKDGGGGGMLLCRRVMIVLSL